MSEPEEILTGGNVSGPVVRIGLTVRKPWTAATPDVNALLDHLHQTGFDAAPRSLGRDPQGRQVLEYIPGRTVTAPELLSLADLSRIGRMIRDLHAATATFAPPPNAHWNVILPPDAEETICHHDLSPWNLVRDTETNRWVFIDWDNSGPGSILWDVAHAAQSFVLLKSGGNPTHDATRLKAFAHGYGLSPNQRKLLPQKLADRTRAGFRLLEQGAATGTQPWARLYAEGHGTYWKGVADYVEKYRNVWREALLSDEN